MKLVYLEWQDAHCNNGWMSEPELKEWSKGECIINEVGWIAQENKNQIILVSRKEDMAGNRSFGLIQKIPKTWIRKRIDLTKHIK